jgi:tetrapyrrole methylase family protein/MazG family protein
MLDALIAEARDRWGLDVSAGIQVVASEHLTATPIEASRPLLVVPLAILAGDAGAARGTTAGGPGVALPGRHGPDGLDPIRLLRRLYPADAAVARLGDPVARPGPGSSSTIEALQPTDLRFPLYMPPIAPELASAGPWSMPYISARLRQPDGCPWDREQTHASLRKHLLEETYEVYDALERGATPELAEELGDLLLQVVLHAQLAAEAGVFDLGDVQASIARKIVRRHPHVFGDAVAKAATKSAADVNRQWERIKASERAEAAGATGESVKSALDGISPSMPALAASQEMQERAAALGYDWPNMEGVLEKVEEELGELARAASAAERQEEFGDLLLVVVNVGRRLGIESEAALRAANHKFRSRFRRVERMVAERGATMRDLDFATLDQLWDAAKAEERAAAADRTVTVGSGGER